MADDLKQQAINAQLQTLDGIDKWIGKREIRELPSILWENETLKQIVVGWYKSGYGILVATDRRLIFIDKGMLGGLRVEDFAYDKISSIEYNTSWVSGQIIIYASGNKAVIEQVAKDQCRSFCDNVRALIDAVSSHSRVTPEQPSQDYVAELERLAELKNRGIITEEDFLAKKKQLLGL